MTAIDSPSPWIAALAHHRASVEAAPAWSSRRLGRLMMSVGVAACAAGVPASLALMNVGFAIAAVGALLARAPFWRMPGFTIGCALSAWVGISILATRWMLHQPAATGGAALAYGWLSIPIAIIALDEARARRWALNASACVLVAAAALALAQFAIGWRRDDDTWYRFGAGGARWERASGFLGGGLTLGGVSALMLLAHLDPGPRRRRVAAIAAAAIGLVVSVSRMAWLAAAAGGVIRLIAGRRWKSVIFLAVGVPLVAAAALAAFHPSTLRNSLHGDDGRLVIWRVSSDLIAERPWLGSGGARVFRSRYAARWHERYGDGAGLAVVEPTVAHAHDSALSCAALYGVPAAVAHIAWCAALAWAAVRGRRRSPAAAGAALAAIAAFVVAGLFNDAINQMEYVYAFAVAFGLGASGMARSAGQ